MLKRETESRGLLAAAYLTPGIVAGVAAGAVAATFWSGWPPGEASRDHAGLAVHLHEASCPEPVVVGMPTGVPEAEQPGVELVLDDEWAGVPLNGFEQGWNGVAASRGVPMVALWSEQTVLVAVDPGYPFTRILDGEGPVRGVAVGATGTVFALRDRLGIWRAGTTHWVDPPLPRILQIGVGGGRVAMIGFPDNVDDDQPTLVSSADYGRNWLRLALPQRLGNDANAFRFEADGAIHVMGGSEAGCGGGNQWHYAGHLGALGWVDLEWPLDASGRFVIGSGGWAYALDEDCSQRFPDYRPGALCAVSPPDNSLTLPMTGFRADHSADATLSIADNGQVTFAVYSGQLFELRGAELIAADDAPENLTSLVVDSAGRPLALTGGRLVRWSRNPGWRLLPISVASAP